MKYMSRRGDRRNAAIAMLPLKYGLLAKVSLIALTAWMLQSSSRSTTVTQFLEIGKSVGVWEALVVFCFNLTNSIVGSYYHAMENSDVELHRALLDWNFRATLGGIPGMYPMGKVAALRLRETNQSGEFRLDPNGALDDKSITLSLYVSQSTLSRHPHLSKSLSMSNITETVNPDVFAPATVFIHGGGFVFLNTQSYDKILRRVAHETSTVVIAIDYRQPPKHPYPTPLNDCLGAMQWLHDHSSQLGLNMDRFPILGDSAGGNLALGMVSNALHYPQRFLWAKSISTLGLVYPVICMHDCHTPSRSEFAELFFSKSEAMGYFATQYLSGEKYENDWSVHPKLIPDHVLGAFPPTFISLSSHDTLRDEGLEFFDQMRDVGVNATVHLSMGVHGLFGSNFSKGGNEALLWLADAVSNSG